MADEPLPSGEVKGTAGDAKFWHPPHGGDIGWTYIATYRNPVSSGRKNSARKAIFM